MSRKPRKRYNFWLNRDSEFCDYIVDLKKVGMFTSSVRDGLRLLESLRRGDLSELIKQFPELEIVPKLTEADIRRIIQDEMSKAPRNAEQPVYEQRTVAQATPDALPEPTIKAIKRTPEEQREYEFDHGKLPSYNAMLSALGFSSGDPNDLPEDVQKYAVKNKLLSADVFKSKPKPAKTGAPKAMVVPQFDTPDFDEISL